MSDSDEQPEKLQNEQDQKDVDIFSRKVKTVKIMSALRDNSLRGLKKCAIDKYGLVTDDIRRKVWPKLIKADIFETSPKPSQAEIESHPYYTQVVLDVNRSLKRFPPSIQEQQRLAMQDQLIALIMRILIKHPKLHYYQGYHDICVTFLLVLGEEIGFNIIEKLSTNHLSVFMEVTMENTSKMIEHIYPLIGRVSGALQDFLEKAEVGVMFCLSWIITWFGHVLVKYDDVVRLFDFFLSSDPWMPLYLSAAIVLHFEDEIMDLDCEMPCVHSFLTKLPDRDLPFDELLVKAQVLIKSYTPQDLKEEMKRWEVSRTRYTPGASISRRITSRFPIWTIPFVKVAALVVTFAVLYQIYTCSKRL